MTSSLTTANVHGTDDTLASNCCMKLAIETKAPERKNVDSNFLYFCRYQCSIDSAKSLFLFADEKGQIQNASLVREVQCSVFAKLWQRPLAAAD
jgi:hypothetical protein